HVDSIHRYCILFTSAVTLIVLHSFPTRRSSDLDRREAERDQDDQRVLEDVVVERAQRLRDEERREAPLPQQAELVVRRLRLRFSDRKSTRLNSSHVSISYAVFCLKKKKKKNLKR